MTIKEEVQEMLSMPIYAHPSREYEERCKRLELVVLFLAEKVEKAYQEGFERGYDGGKEDAEIEKQ